MASFWDVTVLAATTTNGAAVVADGAAEKVLSLLKPLISLSVKGRAETILISNLGLAPFACGVGLCVAGGATAGLGSMGVLVKGVAVA